MSAYKFAARYPGRCRACDESIEVGDDLVMDDNQAVHFDCASTRPLPSKPREVCPRCFIERAVNGDCGCEP